MSNRPDLCEYQCNGAMAGAKKYGKAPFMIADAVAKELQGNEVFSSVESAKNLAEKGLKNITRTASGMYTKNILLSFFFSVTKRYTRAQR